MIREQTENECAVRISAVNTGYAAELVGICRRYTHPDGSLMVDALRGVDLSIPMGQYIAIMGASGSGKSTLMNILGCLDRPTAGEYRLDGIDVESLDDERLSQESGVDTHNANHVSLGSPCISRRTHCVAIVLARPPGISLINNPSLRRMMRCERSATRSSCVTRTIVNPAACS